MGATLLAGCLGRTDSDDSDTGGSEPSTPSDETGTLRLTSTAFEDGEQIPEQYGYDASNVNPPLAFENIPEGVESLAIVVDDPDAVEPAGKVWDHWVVWNIPPDTETIPEDWTPSEAQEGQNDYGETGYGGPNPPDSEHTYRFKLFALDTTLDLPADAGSDVLESAMQGHIVAQTELEGTYPAG